jgi:hypothetical protein
MAGKISSLDELGMTAIYLDSTITNATDRAGNTAVRSGRFEWSDGTSGIIADYSLQHDTGDTVPLEEVEVPADIAALPNLIGHGNVYSLHQAMVRDTSGQLKSLVEQFSAAPDAASRETLMTRILSSWIGVGSSLSGSGVGNYEGSRLAVLEGFFGQRLIDYRYIPWLVEGRIRIPHESVASFNNTYREIFEGYYGGLMAQTHLKDLYDKVVSAWDVERLEYRTDMSGVTTELQARMAANPEEGKQLLAEFARTWRSLNNGAGRDFSLSFREALVGGDMELGWIFDAAGMPVYYSSGQGAGWSEWVSRNPWIRWSDDAVKGALTEGDGYIYSLDGNDVVYGTARDETLSNLSGNAILVAGGGNDTIWAGPGNDILDGGEGRDVLYGETGNDTYIFRRGSGQDTIIDYDPTPGNIDTIFLGSSLTPEDITLRRAGDNLVLKIKDTDDTLTVKDFFRSVLNKIEKIQFMDGTVWTEADITRLAHSPTEGDDIVYAPAA